MDKCLATITALSLELNEAKQRIKTLESATLDQEKNFQKLFQEKNELLVALHIKGYYEDVMSEIDEEGVGIVD